MYPSLSPRFAVYLASTLTVAAGQLATLCDQYSYVVEANFGVNNNCWGESSASSGSQCTYVDYASGDTISWHTGWTWEGDSSSVKSYGNAGLNIGATLLSSITSMPTTWSWT